MNLEEIRERLSELSEEMTGLIRRYKMEATSSLEVLKVARRTINCPDDYLRFLELSLEGRILADEGEHLAQTDQNPA